MSSIEDIEVQIYTIVHCMIKKDIGSMSFHIYEQKLHELLYIRYSQCFLEFNKVFLR